MENLLKEYTEEMAKELTEKLATLKSDDKDTGGTFKVIATTETNDRDGEVIKLDGRDFKNFMKNPVILANHYYSIENIIGKATKVYVENGNVIVEGVFSKTSPAGQLAQNLYEEGMLKTVSVGFIVKQRNEEDKKIIEKAELLELSFVAVPANPDALSLDEKLLKKGLELGLIKMTDDEEENEEEMEDEVGLIQNIFDMVVSIQKDIEALKEKSMTDDNVKQDNDSKYFAKETLQEINRMTSESLRSLKNKG